MNKQKTIGLLMFALSLGAGCEIQNEVSVWSVDTTVRQPRSKVGPPCRPKPSLGTKGFESQPISCVIIRNPTILHNTTPPAELPSRRARGLVRRIPELE